MRREIVEPTVTHEDGPIGGTIYRHASFGQIEVTKVSGRTNLYGTDFEHNSFVQIKIYESEDRRNLSRNWHFPTKVIASLYMSEAQWATFISSFGVHGGSPCTLVFANGTERPGFPLRDTGQDYKIEANKVTEDSIASLRAMRAKMVEKIGKLSKADQAELLKDIDKSISDLASSLPFIVDSFSEHMEDRVEKAKIEVAAIINNAVTAAGLEALGAKNAYLASASENGRKLLEGHADPAAETSANDWGKKD